LHAFRDLLSVLFAPTPIASKEACAYPDPPSADVRRIERERAIACADSFREAVGAEEAPGTNRPFFGALRGGKHRLRVLAAAARSHERSVSLLPDYGIVWRFLQRFVVADNRLSGGFQTHEGIAKPPPGRRVVRIRGERLASLDARLAVLPHCRATLGRDRQQCEPEIRGRQKTIPALEQLKRLSIDASQRQ